MKRIGIFACYIMVLEAELFFSYFILITMDVTLIKILTLPDAQIIQIFDKAVHTTLTHIDC